MNKKEEFTKEEIAAFTPDEKVGLVATVNPEGLPHITLITSLQALDAAHMSFGEFSHGLSKSHVQNNPHVGFLLMTLDKSMWRGKALWTHRATEGPEYEMYNEKPMFRYNTYFGINTVHYMDLVETTPREPLPMGKIILSSLATKAVKGAAAMKHPAPVLKPLAQDIFSMLDSLKFIAYIDNNGFPDIIPVIQCQAADSGRLVFSTIAYGDELSAIPAHSMVALYALTMQMENVLVRGTFSGLKRTRGFTLGSVDISWVYNSMPPAHGQVYPELPLEAVLDF
ncbi:MAG TPA: pyridoxamine 5'-phosphate oxidase family protein [Spirochaetota bacterium]|nr:pyridoxamine 5'-phosphate oxidase family protein [Spirochaetota bacterium]